VAEIQGSYDERFAAVPGVLGGLLDDGDAGASVAVFVAGDRGLEIITAAYDGLKALRA
jgi:hypothetical protein